MAHCCSGEGGKGFIYPDVGSEEAAVLRVYGNGYICI